jgi:hypothetical protein
MPYKDLELRKAKNKEYVALYRLRLKEKLVAQPKEDRFCKFCKVDISHKRNGAIFCTKEHKRMFFDAQRDYVAEYQKNKPRRQELGLKYYYADHEKSKNRLRLAQKKRLPLIAAYEAKRRAIKLQRTPKWLTAHDVKVIDGFYSISAMLTRENKESWHVDHIIPLRGKLVSGLHVPSNLQVMRGLENIGKNNRYEVV